MDEYQDPQPCPECSRKAPRVMLTAPKLWTMAPDRRLAAATNERSSNEPMTLSRMRKHGAGCSCCGGTTKKRGRLTAKTKNGSKSFPTSRPWMISH